MDLSDDSGKIAAVWKFGYGSNISPEFLRTKKNLNVLDCKRSVLAGFTLSFPRGGGVDLVEPSFATLRRDPEGVVHGTCCLIAAEDAAGLDQQERGYNIEKCAVRLYDDDTGIVGSEELTAEVYAPKGLEPEGHPQGPCSIRYRDIMVQGATEVRLDPAWIAKLKELPVYMPSAETLAAREELPIYTPLASLPQMTIAELALHNGSSEDTHPVYTSSCGYVFEQKPMFRSHWGRDITFRNLLQRRGINMDTNDDGGQSPFPVLAELAQHEPEALEYALQYRDRINSKAGAPLAVLKEFWEDQSKAAAVAAAPGDA